MLLTRPKNIPKKPLYIIIGVLIAVGVMAFLTAPYLRNIIAPPAHVTHSYGTGRISIGFKEGTGYQHARQVLNDLGLTNTRADFMQPYVAIINPVSVESNSITELNAFNATLDKLTASAGVDHFTYADNSQIYVYFEPTVSEAAASDILAKLNLKIASGARFRKSYDAEVRIPPGKEPEHINALYRDNSVKHAAEPVVTTN